MVVRKLWGGSDCLDTAPGPVQNRRPGGNWGHGIFPRIVSRIQKGEAGPLVAPAPPALALAPR